MARYQPWLALALLAAFLLLGACNEAPSVTVSLTATTPPAPTAMPTLLPAPTPEHVPAGWVVLDTPYFSLAYPADWTTQTLPDGPRYFIAAPTNQSQVMVAARLQGDVLLYSVHQPMPARSTRRLLACR